MKFLNVLKGSAALTALAVTSLTAPAFAQDGNSQEAAADDEFADTAIVVTAVARGQNQLESSVSVSSLGAEAISDLNPSSSADLIRQLPGIRSEASGGEGNANIAIRGLPVSTGGARYIQLQEDGLPVLEFGDIIFGNADNFLRADRTVARVEAVRGGSASTFASNAPGGVINFISKTGREEGGAVALTAGLDYETYRVDFDAGKAIGPDLYFHVGGYARVGEGARELGFQGSRGGQIKANLTKEFSGGYVRVYGKYLDDNTATFLPYPVLVTGTGSDPVYSSLPNFDVGTAALQSRFITNSLTLDGDNEPRSFNMRDGLSVRSEAIGLEAEVEFGGGWVMTERFRYASNSGGFTSPFPASVGEAQDVADGVGGAGSSLFFASGPNRGQLITDPASLGGNGLITSVVLFNVRLNNLDNFTNDLRLSNEVEIGGNKLAFTAGFYASRQEINTDWLWTSFLQSTEGGGNSVLIDVRDAGGNLVTQDGTVGFGASFFGNCCRRNYDVQYDTYAPFASASFEAGNLTLDGSVRYDFGNAKGTISGADTGFGNGVTSFDFNNDNFIDPAEAQTSLIPAGSTAPVDYNFNYLSYSVGANYLLADNLSVFARYSDGGRHIADRALFSPAVSVIDGSVPSEDGVIADVKQLEGGIKYRSGGLGLFATGFFAKTKENNIEIAPLEVIVREFEAYGVELEGRYRTGPLTFSAGATWTDAEIKDDTNAALVGNTPRRQADLIFQGSAQYDSDFFTLGVNAVGTTESFAQDNNDLVLPGYTQVNAFLAVRPVSDIEFSLNATNLFDTTGFTESEEGSIPGNNIIRARSIAGRTISASVRLDF
ncbi:TonB-dependent receptor domain-containing protein [Allopontixanthobacter sp.]|uniref:TonB-dependent receptor domain-containing protein n=1 Tax=Allopontixanthobacter sp. TaxID=2906452 RepID=UPI002ABBB83D|nr:TonB-dependent receptor [Allopontixanthobacter sp.]MDZ4308089.1 TonB-dependent receptor [Allopontixanthobacter sp.]